jgi:propionyl-CoA carboxylase alpha chain
MARGRGSPVSGPLRVAYRDARGGPASSVSLSLDGERATGEVDGSPFEGEVRATGPHDLVLREGGRTHRAVVVREGDDLLVWVGDRAYRLRPAADEPDARPSASSSDPFATSPMTGLVAKVAVAPGDDVPAGGVLFVVEAMKMEYVVRSPSAARVREVRRKAGERVAQGEVVVALEPAP